MKNDKKLVEIKDFPDSNMRRFKVHENLTSRAYEECRNPEDFCEKTGSFGSKNEASILIEDIKKIPNWKYYNIEQRSVYIELKNGYHWSNELYDYIIKIITKQIKLRRELEGLNEVREK